MKKLLPLLFFTALALGLSCSALAKDPWAIVPGVSIGQVRIGMEHSDVLRLLGTPTLQEDLGAGKPKGAIHIKSEYTGLAPQKGVIRDDWIKPLPVPKEDGGVAFMSDFVTVYFQNRKVVQIEERVARFKTAEGLSVGSTANDFRKKYPNYQATEVHYRHPSDDGWPAYKHTITFEDAVKQGIAWRYGVMANMGADTDPAYPLETVIVHAPNGLMIFDPDGGARFIWKDAPVRHSGN
ncbi:MAG: hypothetical protein WCD79_06885 [Chthoniobacteraceae bacterium]